jgi:hypothetical protein
MSFLREVVTRFRLDMSDVDKGFKSANRKTSELKSTLSSLAGAFGIGLGFAGAVAVGKMGLSAERTRFQLERMVSPEKYRAFQQIFENVRNELNSVRAGAANILRPATFNQAAAAWSRAFGDGEEYMVAFGEMFKFASKQSALTGKEVADIMEELQSAIETGGFDALLDIPGFDRHRQQMMEFISQAQTTGAPGGEVDRLNRMRLVMDAIGASSKGQNEQMKKLPGELLSAQSAGNKLQETLQKLGHVLDKLIVPALEKIVQLLQFAVNKTAEAEAGATAMGLDRWRKDTFKSPSSVGSAWLDGVKEMGDSKKWKRFLGLKADSEVGMSSTPLMSLPGIIGGLLSRDMQMAKDKVLGAAGNVSVTNNINIRSTDPEQAGKETANAIDRTIRDARAVPLTEGK